MINKHYALGAEDFALSLRKAAEQAPEPTRIQYQEFARHLEAQVRDEDEEAIAQTLWDAYQKIRAPFLRYEAKLIHDKLPRR